MKHGSVSQKPRPRMKSANALKAYHAFYFASVVHTALSANVRRAMASSSSAAIRLAPQPFAFLQERRHLQVRRHRGRIYKHSGFESTYAEFPANIHHGEPTILGCS